MPTVEKPIEAELEQPKELIIYQLLETVKKQNPKDVLIIHPETWAKILYQSDFANDQDCLKHKDGKLTFKGLKVIRTLDIPEDTFKVY